MATPGGDGGTTSDPDEQLEFELEDSTVSGDYWSAQGYESEEDFWAELKRQYADDPLAASVLGISIDAEAVPDVGVPELSEIPSPALERELSVRRGFRQVGIKLRPDDYDALATAAEMYGITPTTLARILTARGARELAERGPTPRSASGA